MSNRIDTEKVAVKWQHLENQGWEYVKNLEKQARSAIKSEIEDTYEQWVEIAARNGQQAVRIPLYLQKDHFRYIKQQYAALKKKFKQCQAERDQYQNQCNDLAARVTQLTQQSATFSQNSQRAVPYEEQKMMQSTGSFSPYFQEESPLVVANNVPVSPIRVEARTSTVKLLPTEEITDKTAARQLGSVWYRIFAGNKKYKGFDSDMVERIGLALEVHESSQEERKELANCLDQVLMEKINWFQEVVDHKICVFFKKFILKPKYFQQFVEYASEKFFGPGNVGVENLTACRKQILDSVNLENEHDLQDLIEKRAGNLKPNMEINNQRLEELIVTPFVQALLDNIRLTMRRDIQQQRPAMKRNLLDEIMSYMNKCHTKGLDNISKRFKKHGKLSVAGSSVGSSGMFEIRQFAGNTMALQAQDHLGQEEDIPTPMLIFSNALHSSLTGEFAEVVRPIVDEELKPIVAALVQSDTDMQKNMGLRKLIMHVQKQINFIEPEEVRQNFVAYLQEGVDNKSQRDEVINHLQALLQL